MNKHQRIDAALCDKPSGNNRLAEGRRRRQHTDLMFQHRIGGQLLLRSQLALKGHLQWLSAVAFIVDDGPNIQVRRNLTDIVQTAARDADVTGATHIDAASRAAVVCPSPSAAVRGIGSCRFRDR
jgi:hypothetical protein